MSRRYFYGSEIAPRVGGVPLHFRTVTSFSTNSSGRVIDRRIDLYYTGVPGSIWVPGNGSPTSHIKTFKQGRFSIAAVSTNGGKTFTTSQKYTQDDSDRGAMPPGKKVGDPILGQDAVKSLNTPGGSLNEAVQQSVIDSLKDEPGLAKQVVAKLQNTISEPPKPNPPDGTPPPTSNPRTESTSGLGPEQNPNSGQNELVVAVPLVVAAPGGLRYPADMDEKQDKIKFQAVKIKDRPDNLETPKYEKVGGGPVVLGIQAPISDQNSVDWGPGTINAIEQKLYEKSKEMMGDNKNLNPQPPFDAKTLGNVLSDNKSRIQSYLGGLAAGVNNILARTDGVILNPNLELLFQGPQLRPFSFQFKLSARNAAEAKNIKSIIKYFKYNMAVRKERGLFLKAPHVFTIRYIKGNDENHPGINLISPTDDEKACALTNCSVDYTPLGTYMTYEDTEDYASSGTMVSYTLSLQFQEITPIYDEDYMKEKQHPIGF